MKKINLEVIVLFLASALSKDTIKKRKSKIKDLLGIEKRNDEDILKECRILGIL